MGRFFLDDRQLRGPLRSVIVPKVKMTGWKIHHLKMYFLIGNGHFPMTFFRGVFVSTSCAMKMFFSQDSARADVKMDTAGVLALRIWNS